MPVFIAVLSFLEIQETSPDPTVVATVASFTGNVWITGSYIMSF
jgi:hypothetical protein